MFSKLRSVSNILKEEHLILGELFIKISPTRKLAALYLTLAWIFFLGILFYFLGEIGFLEKEVGLFLIFVDFGWVCFSVDIAYRKHFDIYRNAASRFVVEPDFVKKHAASTFDEKLILTKRFIPTVVLVETYLCLTYYKVLPVPSAIYNAVYAHPIALAFFLIFGVAVSYIYAVSAHLLFQHLNFVKKLTSHDLKVSMFDLDKIDTLESRLYNIFALARFSLLVSMEWFAGLTVSVMVIVLFLKVADVLTLTFVFISSLVGIVIFIWPEIYVHRSLVKVKQKLKEEISDIFKVKIDKDAHPSKYLNEISSVYYLLSNVGNLREWSANYVLVTEEILGIFMPVVGFLLSSRFV